MNTPIFGSPCGCQGNQLPASLPTPNAFQSVTSCRTVTVTGSWGVAGDTITEVKWFQVFGSNIPTYRGSVFFNERTRAAVTAVDTTNTVQCSQAQRDEQTNFEEDASYSYFAFSPAGTPIGTQGWKAYRIDKATNAIKQFAGGSASYSNPGAGLSALTYTYGV